MLHGGQEVHTWILHEFRQRRKASFTLSSGKEGKPRSQASLPCSEKKDAMKKEAQIRDLYARDKIL